MKKQLVIVGMIALLIAINFSGCMQKDNGSNLKEPDSLDKSSNLIFDSHKITESEVDNMKKDIGVYNKSEDISINYVYQGENNTTYYTGLRPPTEEEWTALSENGTIIDTITFAEELPASVDHSSSPYFPPIGIQYKGSCVAWAIGYYIKTFQEAKEHNWDLSGARWVNGAPSKEYQDKIMSPYFLFHLYNGGKDRGTWYDVPIDIIYKIGICSWKEMPCVIEDITSFPSESAWKEAALYRGKTASSEMQMDIYTENGINNLKSLLAGEELAAISVDASQYPDLSYDGDLWTLDNYKGGDGHANTVVGYDNNFGPYIEDGQTRYGAFKIVNSWGKGFMGDHNKDGCYWISYQAMKNRIKYCYMFRDKINYEPKLLAVFQIDHKNRYECEIELGCDTDSKTYRFGDFGWPESDERLPFPNSKIIFDITEFTEKLSSISEEKLYLKLKDLEERRYHYYNGTVGITKFIDKGMITYFSIRYYDDYITEEPLITVTSVDPPFSNIKEFTQYNVDYTYYELTSEITIPHNDVRFYIDKDTYGAGKDVVVGLENNGDVPVYFATSSYWDLQKNVNNKWESKPTGVSLQVITQLDPGDKEEDIWNQKDANNEWVGSGDYRVVTTYSMNNWNCIFTNYAYFSIEEKPSITFKKDNDSNTLTVTFVSPTNILWSDIQIKGIANTNKLGIYVVVGDQITDCSGGITITYLPIDELLGNWMFIQPTDNIKIKISLLKFKVIDQVDTWPDDSSKAQIYFEIYVDNIKIARAPDEGYVWSATVGQIRTVNWTYTYDIPDDKLTPELSIRMYDHDSILNDQLDIDGHDNSKGCTVTYNAATQTWTGDDNDGITDGSDDGTQYSDDDDAYLEYTISTVLTTTPTTPTITFQSDDETDTLTVTSVSPTNILWSNIKISGSYIASGLGTYVSIGDKITNCSGTITMTYIPTNTILSSWNFVKPTTPQITFYQDIKNNLLMVISVDLSCYWSDADKGTSICNLPTGTIKAGDRISGCSGRITLMWKPTNELLGTWTFIAPFTPIITFSQDDEHNKLIVTNANLYLDYDINMDWKIDDTDTNMLTEHYGETGAPGWIREDINNDGIVNYLDTSMLVSYNGGSYGPFSWSDVDKGTSTCNLPTGEISTGDLITSCSGTVILKWEPTNALLGSWIFTNKNTPPDQPSNENPTHQEEWVNPDIGSISCKVTDPDGDSLVVKFYWQDGSLIGTASGINSGGVASVSISTLTRYATKEWYVTISDGISQINGPTWRFTVETYDWDINRDGKVDDTDNSMLTEHYGETGTPGWIREDINNDGLVNYLDVSILSSHYGEEY